MSYKDIKCKRCGHSFKPYPYEIIPFIRDRLHEWYGEALKSNLFTWQLRCHCPYCREAIYGKEVQPQAVQCPICGNWKSKGFCGYCGCPLELTTVIWVQLNLKSSRSQERRSGLYRTDEQMRRETYRDIFTYQARGVHKQLLSSSEP